MAEILFSAWSPDRAVTATWTSRCFTDKLAVGYYSLARCTATLRAVTRAVPESPSLLSRILGRWHHHPLSGASPSHGSDQGGAHVAVRCPLFFQLQQPFFGGTATPRAVPTQPPSASVSSCGLVRASKSLRLGLLASLLGCQHLLQCLFLVLIIFLLFQS